MVTVPAVSGVSSKETLMSLKMSPVAELNLAQRSIVSPSSPEREEVATSTTASRV